MREAVALAFTLAVASTAGRAASVALDVPAPIQGSWVVLRVPGASGRGVVEFLGRELPMFPASGGLRALLPVPLTSAPGARAVTVRVGSRVLAARVRVRRRSAPAKQVLSTIRITEQRAEALNSNKARLGAVLRRVSPVALWGGPLRRPAPGRISAEFGAPRLYGGGAGWPHRGLDFAVERGWPVIAAAPGVVALARHLDEYGNTVVLDHGQTVFTAYLHMTAIQVIPGERVAEGQVIGTVGATGLATGPHLHFGAYIAGVAVDPAELLSRGLP